MIKQASLAICLLGVFSGPAYTYTAAPKPMTDTEKKQAEIRAYFKKTPEELHQDQLKQQMQDQEWQEEQIKQAKRKKAAASGQELKSDGESVRTPQVATPAGSTPPSAPSNTSASKA